MDFDPPALFPVARPSMALQQAEVPCTLSLFEDTPLLASNPEDYDARSKSELLVTEERRICSEHSAFTCLHPLGKVTDNTSTLANPRNCEHNEEVTVEE